MRLIVSICFALLLGSVVAESGQKPSVPLETLPFWPDFPAELQTKATQVLFVDAADATDLPMQIWGEGAGFLFVAASPTQVTFGTVPRMEQAWEVTCVQKECSLKSRSSKSPLDENQSFAAFKAALLFRDHQQNPAPRSDENQTKDQNPILPPVDVFLGSKKRLRVPLIDPTSTKLEGAKLNKGLLQGFRP